MSNVLPSRQLLREFEEVNRTSNVTPCKFIESHSQRIDAATQLEILAVDIEFSLQRGVNPDLEDYIANGFAHLQDELRQVYSETMKFFLAEFCPLRNVLGPIPYAGESYEILREIGRGHTGIVYEAIRPKLNRRVAIKTLFLERKRGYCPSPLVG